MTSTPQVFDPDLAADWRPSVEDVAALIRARTKDDAGNEHGTFDDTTRPTSTQVEILITNGCADVATWVGYELHDSLWNEARNLATIYTACQIEESYYPEQVAAQRSAWEQLWRRYQYGLERLVETAGAMAGPGTVAAREGSILTPSMTVASQWWYLGSGGWGYLPPWIEPPVVNPLDE
jgi:hypothetical protein